MHFRNRATGVWPTDCSFAGHQHRGKCGTRANQLFKMKHGTYGGPQKASKMSFTLLGEILCQVSLKLMAKSDFEKLQNVLDLNPGMLDK